MTLRLGLIGRGRWGRNIERTLQSFDGVVVVPIGRNERPVGLDGVLIATPADTHAELALPYIADGIPTFIEKPMTASVRDAERIREAAHRSGAAVAVGHIHLHNPAFHALLEALPSIGAVRSIDFETMNLLPRQDASVFWDWLPHHLAVAQKILGRMATIVSARPLGDAPATQAASARFVFGDVPLQSTMSWLSPVRCQQLTVICDNGKLLFDDKAEQKLMQQGFDGKIDYPAYGSELPLTKELEHFISRVRSPAVDHGELERSVEIVRMIAAAERSIACGGSVVEIGSL